MLRSSEPDLVWLLLTIAIVVLLLKHLSVVLTERTIETFVASNVKVQKPHTSEGARSTIDPKTPAASALLYKLLSVVLMERTISMSVSVLVKVMISVGSTLAEDVLITVPINVLTVKELSLRFVVIVERLMIICAY